jgi:hypothetical protein
MNSNGSLSDAFSAARAATGRSLGASASKDMQNHHKWPLIRPLNLHQRPLGGLLVRSLPEKEVQSSTSTQAEAYSKVFACDWLKETKNTFFDFSGPREDAF